MSVGEQSSFQRGKFLRLCTDISVVSRVLANRIVLFVESESEREREAVYTNIHKENGFFSRRQ